MAVLDNRLPAPRRNDYRSLNRQPAVEGALPVAGARPWTLPGGRDRRSLPPQFPDHAHQRQDADEQADQQRGGPQVPFDLLLVGRDDAQHRGDGADDGFGHVVEVDFDGRAHGC